MGSSVVKAVMVSGSCFGVGKTTLLYKHLTGNTVGTFPTTGFNHEVFTYKGTQFDIYDVGADDVTLHRFWDSYFADANCIIYVVDASNQDYIFEEREELHKWILSNARLRTLPLLILSNKHDLPNCRTEQQILTNLGLDANSKSALRWHFQETSGVTGAGIAEGLDWLISVLINNS